MKGDVSNNSLPGICCNMGGEWFCSVVGMMSPWEEDGSGSVNWRMDSAEEVKFPEDWLAGERADDGESVKPRGDGTEA